jgi:hypothetical protein
MTNTILKILLAISVCFTVIACSKTDDEGKCVCPSQNDDNNGNTVKVVEVDEYGITQDIYNIVPLYIFNIYNEWGISVNGGNTPPDIEGTYKKTASPRKGLAVFFVSEKSSTFAENL